MRKERKEFKRIEYVDVYVAEDGTEFSTEEQCKKYEASAKFAIEQMVRKIPNQITAYVGEKDAPSMIGCEDTMYALRIRNEEDVIAVNMWVESFGDGFEHNCIGTDAIGSIIFVDVFDCGGGIWTIGTPENMKKTYCDFVDSLYNKLVEEEKEENK